MWEKIGITPSPTRPPLPPKCHPHLVKPQKFKNSPYLHENIADINFRKVSGLPPPICYSENRRKKRAAIRPPFSFVFYILISKSPEINILAEISF
jgi:hypothetical protein